MPDLDRALGAGDALTNVARAAAAPAPTIKIADDLELAASAICTIGALHVQRYERQRLEALSGARGIRMDEVIDLLAVWSRALKAIDEGRPLTARAIEEIEDALDSGEFDDHLTAAERRVVRRWRGY